jgi:hypothetical protein
MSYEGGDRNNLTVAELSQSFPCFARSGGREAMPPVFRFAPQLPIPRPDWAFTARGKNSRFHWRGFCI